MTKIKLFLNEALRFSLFTHKDDVRVQGVWGALAFLFGGFIQGIFLVLVYIFASYSLSIELVTLLLLVLANIIFTRGYFLDLSFNVWKSFTSKWSHARDTHLLAVVFLVFFLLVQVGLLGAFNRSDIYDILLIMPVFARWSTLFPAFGKESTTVYGYRVSQKLLLVLTVLIALFSVLLISLYGLIVMILLFLITDFIDRKIQKHFKVSLEDRYGFIIVCSESFTLALIYLLFTQF